MRVNVLNLKDLLPVNGGPHEAPTEPSRTMYLELPQLSHRIARFSSAPLELVSAEAHIGGSNAARPFAS